MSPLSSSSTQTSLERAPNIRPPALVTGVPLARVAVASGLPAGPRMTRKLSCAAPPACEPGDQPGRLQLRGQRVALGGLRARRRLWRRRTASAAHRELDQQAVGHLALGPTPPNATASESAAEAERSCRTLPLSAEPSGAPIPAASPQSARREHKLRGSREAIVSATVEASKARPRNSSPPSATAGRGTRSGDHSRHAQPQSRRPVTDGEARAARPLSFGRSSSESCRSDRRAPNP